MSEKHSCPCSEQCMLQKALGTIGGKWKLPILCSLSVNDNVRYNDLLRNVKGISNTMLSKSLKELEGAGLVRRYEYMEVPIRVEYELTERAAALQPILLELIQWEATSC
ncbi:MAG: helix-turn-helix transcriptional regulator [Lachnospiraceae bacterium]|nr:helix-turn-helix transcriptional regulator [Lachnospiraceae bacterium]